MAVMSQQSSGEGPCEYHMAGVVRHKLVFSDRPDPIVTRPVAMAGQSKRARLTEVPPAEVEASPGVESKSLVDEDESAAKKEAQQSTPAVTAANRVSSES